MPSSDQIRPAPASPGRIRRAMVLLVVPFALGTVVYLGSLITPPLPESAGNTVAAVPLLVILLAAMVLSLGRGSRARPDAPGRPAASGGA